MRKLEAAGGHRELEVLIVIETAHLRSLDSGLTFTA